MRKVVVFLLVMTLALSFATAEEDGIGLTIGAEFGILEVNRPDNADDVYPYLAPFVSYENSFLNDALDLYTELSVVFGFWDDNPIWLYFDVTLGYNFFLGDASTLTFSLKNEFDEVMLSPREDNSNNMVGIVTPAIRFNQGLGFGDIFFEAGVPITYLHHDRNADVEFAFDFTAGWSSNFGLYFEIKAEIPREMDYGMSLIPHFGFDLSGGFHAYIFCRIDAIGANDGDLVFSPAIGVMFSF